MLGDLYKVLSELRGEGNESSLNTKATPNMISGCLKSIFGNSIHILDPLKYYKDSVDPYVQEKQKYMKEITKRIQEENGVLKIPILAIWSTDQHKKSTEILSSIHWQTLVIVPRNYRLITGIFLNNNTEILFFKDSQAGAVLPPSFKSWLSTVSIHSSDRSLNKVALFTDLEVHDEDISIIQQQLNETDCGWWAIYNSCMFLLEGSTSFLQKFIEDPNLMNAANKLRSIFCECAATKMQYTEESTNIFTKYTNECNLSFPLLSEKSSLQMIPDELSRDNPISKREKIELNKIDTSVIHFDDLVTLNPFFVDKSLLIKELLDDGDSHLIITRPRRWGKSINMSMLKTFFSLEVDSKDLCNIKTPNRNYPLFAGGAYTNIRGETFCLKQLQIANAGNRRYLDYQGKSPVINISFTIATEEEVEAKRFTSVRSSIARAFIEHEYLLNFLEKKITGSTDLDAKNRLKDKIKKFKRYTNINSKIPLLDSIKFLARLLFGRFKTRVIVLIDEYDWPISSLFGSTAFEKILLEIKVILINTFKVDNGNIFGKVILCGVLSLTKGNEFSGLNNFKLHGVYSIDYSKHFGFTLEEVTDIIQIAFNSSGAELQDQLEQIKEWYNGYVIGNSMIYNPWSIMNFVKDARHGFTYSFKPYWVDSASSQIIEKLYIKLNAEKKVQELLASGYVTCDTPLSVNFNTITNYIEFFALLHHTGYLTRGNNSEYRIPNYEVKNYFCRTLIEIWKSLKNPTFDISSAIEILCSSLDNLPKYIAHIKELILDKWTEESMTEADFQILLGGVSMLYANVSSVKHIFHSEVSNKFLKRVDTIFYPIKNRSDTAIIHEYKKITSSILIQKTLEDGAWQIYVKKYMHAALEHYKAGQCEHWNNIVTRVIVFSRDEYARKWIVRSIEFKHSISDAIKIDSLFSLDGGLLENHEALVGNNTPQVKAARKSFLSKHKAKSLYALLEPYQLLPIKQPAKHEEDPGPCKVSKAPEKFDEISINN